jgi:hypothetical protein
MKVLQIILAMVALLQVTIQSFRHAYILWGESRGSVLTRYEKTDQEIIATKSVDKLVALHEAARQKVRDWERNSGQKEKDEAAYYKSQEPHKSEEKLKKAIEAWEDHHRQIGGLHFYWCCGLLAIAVGLAAYVRVHRWLGMAWLIAGFAEMLWWTSPSFRILSSEEEFDRLLLVKFVYSLATLALLLGVGFCLDRSWQRHESASLP